jgi:acetoin utilization deacetylase AcuC-like enzyme
LHQHPKSAYPGTGYVEEAGLEKGRGYSINVPLPPGAGDADYRYLLDEFLLERIRKFAPDFIGVSAGFDSHRGDPLGRLRLTEKGYWMMTSKLMEIAEESCGGKLAMLLEGGYNPQAVATCSHTIVKTLLGEAPELEIRGEHSPETIALTEYLKEVFATIPI